MEGDAESAAKSREDIFSPVPQTDRYEYKDPYKYIRPVKPVAITRATMMSGIFESIAPRDGSNSS